MLASLSLDGAGEAAAVGAASSHSGVADPRPIQYVGLPTTTTLGPPEALHPPPQPPHPRTSCRRRLAAASPTPPPPPHRRRRRRRHQVTPIRCSQSTSWTSLAAPDSSRPSPSQPAAPPARRSELETSCVPELLVAVWKSAETTSPADNPPQPHEADSTFLACPGRHGVYCEIAAAPGRGGEGQQWWRWASDGHAWDASAASAAAGAPPCFVITNAW